MALGNKEIWGYGQDEVDMSTRKYRVFYIATPIHDLSEIHEGDKLVVMRDDGELRIRSNLRGLHKEE